MSLRVSIVGAGPVGTTLGKQITRKYPVIYGVRDTSKYFELAKTPNSSVASVPEAIKSSDVVILATPGQHDEDRIKEIAASLAPDINGKVLIDATNPLSSYPALEVRWNGLSGGEVLAAALPGTSVFKAFNTIGVEHMAHPDGSLLAAAPGPGPGARLSMLLCGGPGGREAAEAVVEAVGFQPRYVGGIRYARNLEAVAELYIHVGLPGVGAAHGAADWGRNIHFQVLKKED